jgi:hypothetical protein
MRVCYDHTAPPPLAAGLVIVVSSAATANENGIRFMRSIAGVLILFKFGAHLIVDFFAARTFVINCLKIKLIKNIPTITRVRNYVAKFVTPCKKLRN